MKKIFFLHEYIVEHYFPLFEELIKNKFEIHVIQTQKSSHIPKKWLNHNNIFWYKKKNFGLLKIINLLKKNNPVAIIICGWIRIVYIFTVFYFKNLAKKKIKIILISDNIWKDTIKQKFLRYLAFFKFMQLFADKIWTHAGPLHSLYAKKIFFSKSNILYHLFSADTDKLNAEFRKFYFLKKKNYPKKIIFVGRFEKIKGIMILLEAWKRIEEKRGWKLHFIGEGSVNLKHITKGALDIEVSKFKTYKFLFKEIQVSGCLVLPSLHEPWGMVVHEFAAAGLPLILSDQVGSRFSYLINFKNGYLFKSNNVNSLIYALKKIINASDRSLLKMSKISVQLSKKTTPSLGANSLIRHIS
jgi:glycosyltransferase involved in cell wall biosynthesis